MPALLLAAVAGCANPNVAGPSKTGDGGGDLGCDGAACNGGCDVGPIVVGERCRESELGEPAPQFSAPGLDGKPELWKVGTFRYLAQRTQVDDEEAGDEEGSDEAAAPSFRVKELYSKPFANPAWIEVTYAARPTSTTYLPEYFAEQAQTRILASVKKLRL